MHQVGELDAILDKEDRHVVADQIPVSIGGVELRGEAAHIAHGVGRSTKAYHCREANEHRRLHRYVLEDCGSAEFRKRLVELEVSMRRRASGMHHPLGNPLVIEMGHLLTEVEIFHQSRTTRARRQRVVGVVDSQSGVRRQILSCRLLGIALQRILLAVLVGGNILLVMTVHRSLVITWAVIRSGSAQL